MRRLTPRAATEFNNQFTKTEFGVNLVNYAAFLEKAGNETAKMRSILYYMDPAKLPPERVRYWDRAGEATFFARRMELAWSTRVFHFSLEKYTSIPRIREKSRFNGKMTIPESSSKKWLLRRA